MKRMMVAVAFLLGILNGSFQSFQELSGEFTNVVLEYNYRDFKGFKLGFLTTFMELIVPFFVFEILYGVSIYQHFGTANAYIFTRQSSRVRWFYQEAGNLFFYSLLYVFIYMSGALGMAWMGNDFYITGKSVLAMVCILVLETLFLYVMTLCINLFSILWNSMCGFLMGIAVQVFAVGILIIYDVLPVSWGKGMLFRLNPVPNFILRWHSTSLWKEDTNRLGIFFPVWFSILYYVVFIIILVAAGRKIIWKDILSEQSE